MSRILWGYCRAVVYRGGRVGASHLYLVILLTLRLAFSAATVQFHLDGDNTVSLLQANDWMWTPHKSYFWGQDYMGTTEVWLFSWIWRAVFGPRTNIPVLYWVFVGQILFVGGAALVYTGLLDVDRPFWSRPRTFLLCLALFGFAAPVFQKYSFGLGHGYSAGPFYGGLAIFMYLRRERIRWGWWLVAGMLMGQSHYIFRLHLVYPVALLIATLSAGPRMNMARTLSLAAGVMIGMIPETLWTPGQGYDLRWCLGHPSHVIANVREAFSQMAVHFGTVPDSLVESEHALWFTSRVRFPEAWTVWGERIGMLLTLSLLAVEVPRALKSSKYRIFLIIFLVNVVVVVASCVSLDSFSARRYFYLSSFSIVFFMLNGPWTIAHRISMSLRTVALLIYAVSAIAFTTPLAAFNKVSTVAGFDARQDCLVGSGGELSALLALNGLRAKTVDLDWRLRGNYSRNVSPTETRDRCRKLFWVDTHRFPLRRIESFCGSPASYFVDSPRGVVVYPQTVSFAECQNQPQ